MYKDKKIILITNFKKSDRTRENGHFGIKY